MVHTRNGSNYSVQPDGCGQGRGTNKYRRAKSSSRKTHLEDARIVLHSPRSVPIDFDVNSEPELIHDNNSRAEPFLRSRNRNISMPIQKLVQSSQRRGVGNMPKPLAGGHKCLLTHQELSGSGEDHRTLRRLEPTVLQRQGQKDKELVKEQKSFIHRPEERVGNDSSFGDRGTNGIYQLQTSFRSLQGQSQRTSEEEERSQEPSRKRQSQSQLAQTLPTRVQDPQIGAFICVQCVQYGQTSDGIHSQGARKDEQDLSTQINHLQTSINVETGKLDAKLTKITLDISDLKRNDKKYTELYQLTNAKLDSIINACNRIESTCQVQNDEMEDLFIFKMNDKLKILKDHVLKIVENTNQFATNLEKSDSERQKLKNEIIENVEQINKNYEPHMPRHSTPLTEEKLSVKQGLTPFLGENVISAKDIPKLEEWPTFFGE
ncbi:hypothetical protein O181_117873 [Austropuccinia psidii MF-1]|uniref:Uncharacterized protein n=1 Tax=Austropuccinia psidii MF-1 TaxID=1389203 RepID=A0A9Q3KB13_9BASI|nr:hypothetical protein [Austropuccinia psidii MF-1]